ncbi:hypothetical protein AB1N83_013767 [Pleurotus pulmonarius]
MSLPSARAVSTVNPARARRCIQDRPVICATVSQRGGRNELSTCPRAARLSAFAVVVCPSRDSLPSKRRGVGPAIQRGTAMGLRGWRLARAMFIFTFRVRDRIPVASFVSTNRSPLPIQVVHLPYRRRLHHTLRASSTRRRPLASCGASHLFPSDIRT